MSGRNREKYNLYQKEYQKNIGYKYQKKWNEQYLKTDEGKRKNNERTKKNYKHKRDYYLSYHKNYYLNNRSKFLNWKREYRKTKKGKQVDRICCAKRRKKGYVEILPNIFPKDIVIEYHHIYTNLPFVVPLPKELHQSFDGNYTNHLKNHEENGKEWIDFYYNLDVNNFLFLNCIR